ncbi:uncharacterized protein AMSG_10570 [Thecamonas trahens ATCC 50062]|uniref:Uncharacterized protein n=1 Tax=Thecamonas trahens ATCC 50062 TaxID=461836 RepID=A0A0L0DS97_THETB|nr:hypothetical protein AMSG_10570 [Thecamonas trahens ATCC 50062]KNC54911.1 hypothetical protein AMSG_10570 [Thecamonas trahens ATCC 50062]|eukprot:XP_013753501.1 hypothetical protein AMSG_10570 [Thecamonas trahens ATCC 50062]
MADSLPPTVPPGNGGSVLGNGYAPRASSSSPSSSEAQLESPESDDEATATLPMDIGDGVPTSATASPTRSRSASPSVHLDSRRKRKRDDDSTQPHPASASLSGPAPVVGPPAPGAAPARFPVAAKRPRYAAAQPPPDASIRPGTPALASSVGKPVFAEVPIKPSPAPAQPQRAAGQPAPVSSYSGGAGGSYGGYGGLPAGAKAPAGQRFAMAPAAAPSPPTSTTIPATCVRFGCECAGLVKLTSFGLATNVLCHQCGHHEALHVTPDVLSPAECAELVASAANERYPEPCRVYGCSCSVYASGGSSNNDAACAGCSHPKALHRVELPCDAAVTATAQAAEGNRCSYLFCNCTAGVLLPPTRVVSPSSYLALAPICSRDNCRHPLEAHLPYDPTHEEARALMAKATHARCVHVEKDIAAAAAAAEPTDFMSQMIAQQREAEAPPKIEVESSDDEDDDALQAIARADLDGQLSEHARRKQMVAVLATSRKPHTAEYCLCGRFDPPHRWDVRLGEYASIPTLVESSAGGNPIGLGILGNLLCATCHHSYSSHTKPSFEVELDMLRRQSRHMTVLPPSMVQVTGPAELPPPLVTIVARSEWFDALCAADDEMPISVVGVQFGDCFHLWRARGAALLPRPTQVLGLDPLDETMSMMMALGDFANPKMLTSKWVLSLRKIAKQASAQGLVLLGTNNGELSLLTSGWDLLYDRLLLNKDGEVENSAVTALAVSDDGSLGFSGHASGAVLVWSLTLLDAAAHAAMAGSLQGDWVSTSSQIEITPTVSEFRWYRRDPIARLTGPSTSAQAVLGAAITAVAVQLGDQPTLAVAAEGGVVALHSLNLTLLDSPPIVTCAQLVEPTPTAVPVVNALSLSLLIEFAMDYGAVASMAWSPPSVAGPAPLLALATHMDEARIYSPLTTPGDPGLVAVFDAHTSVVSEVCWLIRGSTPFLLTGGWDGNVMFWDVSNLSLSGQKPKLSLHVSDAPVWYVHPMSNFIIVVTKEAGTVAAKMCRLPDLVLV